MDARCGCNHGSLHWCWIGIVDLERLTTIRLGLVEDRMGL